MVNNKKLGSHVLGSEVNGRLQNATSLPLFPLSSHEVFEKFFPKNPKKSKSLKAIEVQLVNY